MTETSSARSLLDETVAYTEYQHLLARITDLEVERNTAIQERQQLLLDRNGTLLPCYGCQHLLTGGSLAVLGACECGQLPRLASSSAPCST